MNTNQPPRRDFFWLLRMIAVGWVLVTLAIFLLLTFAFGLLWLFIHGVALLKP